MGLFKLAYYNNWNIGFVERPISEVIKSSDNRFPVKWVKHSYHNRFFADPFILSVNSREIKVLVEDFPYYDKKGVISLLTVDRDSYHLLERRVILKQPFHMSYPYIFRGEKGMIWVMPEASESNNLYKYDFSGSSGLLTNQRVVIPEPLLDSTIVHYNGKWWLFGTKAGPNSNSDLYIYYSDTPEGPYFSHPLNPVVTDPQVARPGGGFEVIDNSLYRIAQKCDKHYGEAINILKVDELTLETYKEHLVKEVRAVKDEYDGYFHTLNGYDDICVVDGIQTVFAPFRRLLYETINFIRRHC